MWSKQILRSRGFTLVEMVVAIVVLSVGLSGVLMAFQVSQRGSADPLVQRQLLALAQGMLDEVLAHPYASGPNLAGGGCERIDYDDILDYQGYLHAPCDGVTGAPTESLGSYQVEIEVRSGALQGVANSLQVVVTTSHLPSGQRLQLVGWKTPVGI